MEPRTDLVNLTSPSQAKIALFRSLFRGREDVYPRRFESRKTGKAGYAPACANEWVRGICEKPRIKCAECPNRRFLPVTDDVIRWHLSGYDAEGQPFVAGVYPLLQDETCFFLAVHRFEYKDLSREFRFLVRKGGPERVDLSPLSHGRQGDVHRDPLLWQEIHLGSPILLEARQLDQ